MTELIFAELLAVPIITITASEAPVVLNVTVQEVAEFEQMEEALPSMARFPVEVVVVVVVVLLVVVEEEVLVEGAKDFNPAGRCHSILRTTSTERNQHVALCDRYSTCNFLWERSLE